MTKIKIVYNNPWFQVCKEDTMHWVESVTANNAIMLPIFNNDSIIFVRQYRHALSKSTLEIPRGGGEPGDASSKEAAIRELEEETGYRVSDTGRVKKLGFVSPDSGILRATVPIYTVNLSDEDRIPGADLNEITRIEIVPFARLPAYIVSGEIECGITLSAILQAWIIFKNGRFVDPA